MPSVINANHAHVDINENRVSLRPFSENQGTMRIFSGRAYSQSPDWITLTESASNETYYIPPSIANEKFAAFPGSNSPEEMRQLISEISQSGNHGLRSVVTVVRDSQGSDFIADIRKAHGN
jgi:hypothetical protein